MNTDSDSKQDQLICVHKFMQKKIIKKILNYLLIVDISKFADNYTLP